MCRLSNSQSCDAGHAREEALETELRQRIVSQDEAIQQIVNIYQTYLAGMANPGRPIGNFLFLGPTGSGQTRLVDVAAAGLVGDMLAVIKIDCAEFQHSREIAKLIGSPQGYLGHREIHPLLSQRTANSDCVLGHNRRVDFSRAMIFMTSNLGAVWMRSTLPATFLKVNPVSSLSFVASKECEAIGERAPEQIQGRIRC
jgi:ATP-dependent Clp protease ATP-binding subunit ClpB